jgi:hypothetical protein
MTEETPSVELRQAKQRHLASLETFLASEAYSGFRAAQEADIKTTEESILMLMEAVEDQKQIFESLRLVGELRCQRRQLEVFEDARVTLKHRIEEMLEYENQNADNTKV